MKELTIEEKARQVVIALNPPVSSTQMIQDLRDMADFLEKYQSGGYYVQIASNWH